MVAQELQREEKKRNGRRRAEAAPADEDEEEEEQIEEDEEVKGTDEGEDDEEEEDGSQAVDEDGNNDSQDEEDEEEEDEEEEEDDEEEEQDLEDADLSSQIDVVGEGEVEEPELSPEPHAVRAEKDYKHEDAFPQLHTKRTLRLLYVDKKKKTPEGLSLLQPARGAVPSFLSRTIDLTHVPAPSYREVEQPAARSSPGISKKSQKSSPHTDVFHEETQSSNPSEPFQRFVSPTSSHYDTVVEYDMDEQDVAWLAIYNQERKNHNLPEITESVFEVMIDRIEKEWYAHSQTQKARAEWTSEIVHEDSPCDICQLSECEPGNAIVFCDGCDLAVHQDCYGVPYIPEG